MNKKNLSLLIVTAAAAVVLSVLAIQRQTPESMAEPGLLLPGLEKRVNDVATVELRRAGGDTVTLKRAEQGWGVAERNGFPADLGKLRELLLELVAARRLEAKTQDPAKYHYLGLQDLDAKDAPGSMIRFSDASGQQLAELIVGNSDGGQGRFVRVVGDKQSWLSNGVPTLVTDPESWIEKDLVDVKPDRIRRIEVQPSDGQAFSLEKDAPDSPHFKLTSPENQLLSSESAGDELGRALVALQLQDVKPVDGTQWNDSATITFYGFDGLVVRMWSAKQGEDLLSRWEVTFDEVQAQRFAEQEAAKASQTQHDDVANEGADQKGSVPVPAEPLKTAEQRVAEVRQRAEALQGRLQPWVFVLPSHIGKRFDITLEALTKQADQSS